MILLGVVKILLRVWRRKKIAWGWLIFALGIIFPLGLFPQKKRSTPKKVAWGWIIFAWGFLKKVNIKNFVQGIAIGGFA